MLRPGETRRYELEFGVLAGARRDRRVRGVAAVTVARCSASHYRVPREVWWPDGRIGASLYEIDHIELVVVEVETNEGATGAGFTYTVGQGGSAVLALLEDEIAPVLLGRDPHEAEAIWHELHARLHFVGSGGVTAVAIAAADIALWDALACEAGLPLYRHLGAHRTELPAYASAVNLAPPSMSSSRRWPATATRASAHPRRGRQAERVARARDAVRRRGRRAVPGAAREVQLPMTEADPRRRPRARRSRTLRRRRRRAHPRAPGRARRVRRRALGRRPARDREGRRSATSTCPG